MGGMSTRNEIKARLGILAEPKTANARPGAKAKFDSLAKFKAKVVQLVTMLGFKPDEITGNSEMVHVLFMDKPGQADRLAIALRRNLAQVGVPASAITTHEHRYADDDTTYGGVWVDVRALANAKSRASRSGAKAKFAETTIYTVAAHVGNDPAGERTARSLDEAKAYAKIMLEAVKAKAKGKPVVIDVYPVVNYEPKPSVLTLRASRPGAKAKFAAHPENVAWMRSLPASVVNQVRSILQKPHSSARAKQLRDVLKAGGVTFNQWVPDASAGAEVLGHQFRDAFAKSTHEAPAQKPGRKVMAESDPAVSAKIRKLMAEGKPQKQAVAIALDMKRRGEI
jgi:hypothetical protein